MREKLYQNKRNGKLGKRLLVVVMVLSLIGGLLGGDTMALSGYNFLAKAAEVSENDNSIEKTLQKPRVFEDPNMNSEQVVTWDCIWFGNYPQAEVIPTDIPYVAIDEECLNEGDLIADDELYLKLMTATGWNDNQITLDGEKYCRVKGALDVDLQFNDVDYDAYDWWHYETRYHYFKYEPIKWRVLSVDDETALLLSDKVIEYAGYGAKSGGGWDKCTLRSYLNETFINSAFTEGEQTIIEDTALENTDYGEKYITTDKIFVLSEWDVYIDDARAEAYGFYPGFSTRDEAKYCQCTTYVKARGEMWAKGTEYLGKGEMWPKGAEYLGNVSWSLRPETSHWGNSCVNIDGTVTFSSTSTGSGSSTGVRPALTINIETVSDLYSYAGTVSSNSMKKDVPVTTEVPNVTEAPVVTASPAPVQTSIPELQNPVVKESSNSKECSNATWDCLWFGSYPQAEVISSDMDYKPMGLEYIEDGGLIVDDDIYNALKNAKGWDLKGDIILNGQKYRRLRNVNPNKNKCGKEYYYDWSDDTSYHYFKYEPIKWRVLSVENGKALLLSDLTLDCQEFGDCSGFMNDDLIKWLNGEDKFVNENFINNAFTQSEQTAIYGPLFLLSASDVCSTDKAASYGFCEYYRKQCVARGSLSSTYAKAMGADVHTESTATELPQFDDFLGCCDWWLSSYGKDSTIDTVSSLGYVDTDDVMGSERQEMKGVRPVLNIDLSVMSAYTYAGTVCSDGTTSTENEKTCRIFYKYDTETYTCVVRGIRNASEKVVVPEKVKFKGKEFNVIGTVENGAFRECANMTSVELPESITSIEKSTFSGCSKLSDVKMSNKLTSIEAWAFASCSSLTDIEMPESITNIGYGAFSGCSSLKEIKLPDGMTSVNAEVFSDCSSLESIKLPDGMRDISSSLFSGCSSLTSIEIPDGVTSIGDGTFSGCSSLTSIEIPDGVTSIGDGAFSGCSSLTSIEIPDGVTSIGDGAFSGCSSLMSIEIPDGVTSIREESFSECSSLTSIEIPDGVTSIGYRAFNNCSNLSSIKIPNSVTDIGNWAFGDCKNVIIYGYKDSEAERYAKEENIKFVVLKEGDNFNEIKQNPILSTITPVPTKTPQSGTSTPVQTKAPQAGTVTSVPTTKPATPAKNSVLTDTKNKCKVKVTSTSSKNPTVTYTKTTNTKATSVTIPATVTINGTTYKVTAVAASAFSGNKKLTKVTIGKNVKTIGKNAFKNCSKLKTITIKSSVLKSVGSSVLKGTNKKLVVKVPSKKVSAYKKLFKGKGNGKVTVKK